MSIVEKLLKEKNINASKEEIKLLKEIELLLNKKRDHKTS